MADSASCLSSHRQSSVAGLWPRAAWLPGLSSCAALVIVLVGLLELDLPIVRYQRSVTTQGLDDHLRIPWMAFVSDAGNWIGEGWHLLAVSLALLAAGWSLQKNNMTAAGFQSLFAQALAALCSNAAKHLVGRPRPKFVHSGEWQIMPSLAAGLDSFPSGHTTASFAMATVLAKRFPAVGWLAVAVAVFVGFSRVIRGSHFPTDVFGGVVLGVVIGSISAYPWKAWFSSLQEGLRQAAVGTTVAFALLWTMTHPRDGGMIGMVLMGLGLLALTSGLWLRRSTWAGSGQPLSLGQEKASRALLAYGLACMTTSPLVVAAVGCAAIGYYFAQPAGQFSPKPPSRSRRLIVEGAVVASLLLGFTIIFQARGVLPFQ